ncbi:MAG: phosphodiester glycosidase family protein [Bacilli bacterium]|nr:phosphodiester glycosidase family protein [Bacilli bacterium]
MLLVGFTIYFILDTLVISNVYQVVESKSSSDTDTGEVTSTSTSYSDDHIKITIKEYYEYHTKIYVADVEVDDSKYLSTAFAQSSYGKNVTDKTSEIADSVNAILAINGDYYGVRKAGYVIRNGVIYRDTTLSNQEDLVIYEDGSFEIINESDITCEELLKNGAYQVFSFGPGLVDNNKVLVSTSTEVGKAMASNPRTAIGIVDSNHYVFVVSDGRTSESEGLSLYQLGTFLKNLGVSKAYNLDGGGSSTMVFQGTVINNPTTNGNRISEREVSDIVYIGY